MENISEEEYNKAQKVIEEYQKQQKEKENDFNKGVAKNYLKLKGWLISKKQSGNIGEWDCHHHQEVLNKMDELEKENSCK